MKHKSRKLMRIFHGDSLPIIIMALGVLSVFFFNIGWLNMFAYPIGSLGILWVGIAIGLINVLRRTSLIPRGIALITFVVWVCSIVAFLLLWFTPNWYGYDLDALLNGLRTVTILTVVTIILTVIALLGSTDESANVIENNNGDKNE